MANEIFLELVNYFKNKANTLDSKAREAGIFDNTSDIGSAKEDILADFLTSHIPMRCNLIRGGYVFDSLGTKSRQIDIMICNDETIQFRQSIHDNKSKSFNCVEGCYAVISVKSVLNKAGLIDSLENLASVSTVKKIKISPIITNGTSLLKQIPQRIVFAYGGDNIETTNKNLEEYYKTHKVGEYSPDMIIVNNEYYYSKAGPLGFSTNDDQRISYGEYVRIDKSKSKYVGPMALLQLIFRIQTVCTFSPHMMIDFEAYPDRSLSPFCTQAL
jgi:Domain of unknown function (DUF6602)